MSILGICGSHRDESNTNKLIKIIAEASGKAHDLVYVNDLDIKPCTGCSMCMMNEGQCPLEDDMESINEKLMQADALIIGSPTYFMDVSGVVKCLIDRTMAIYYRGVGPEYNPEMPWMGQRPLAGKPAVILTTVAGGGHERAIETLDVAIRQIHRMELVASLAEVVKMNDIDDMPEVIARAEDAGKKLGALL
ncbi:MAG: flavodoxin family protein [Deltaproteobacteria bacterium]|nr:flavodoxin family protein [Deltaproteobacteria bacterium]